jgi:8-oxo-dGTP pyrophosphatase MutT (NUDIX family)
MSAYYSGSRRGQPYTYSRKFLLRHTFRGGAVIWTKFQGKDYYVVFRSLTRPNRGVQLPGGRVERVENIAQTIIREVEEETGLTTKIVCPLGSIYFENPPDDYSKLEVYYIVRTEVPLDITKKWRFTDMDRTKQEMECWCVPVDKDPNFIAAGQDRVIHMFRQWLKDHKKPHYVGKKFKNSQFDYEEEFESEMNSESQEESAPSNLVDNNIQH